MAALIPPAHTILLCGSALFMQVLEALLLRQPGLAVTRSPTDPARLRGYLAPAAPDLAIVELGHCADSLLWPLLQSGSPLVVLDAALVQATLVQSSQRPMREVADLLALLTAAPPATRPPTSHQLYRDQ